EAGEVRLELPGRNLGPPGVQVPNVDPDHQVRRELRVVELLEDELRRTGPEADVLVGRPGLLEAEGAKQVAAAMEVAAGWDERTDPARVDHRTPLGEPPSPAGYVGFPRWAHALRINASRAAPPRAGSVAPPGPVRSGPARRLCGPPRRARPGPRRGDGEAR